MIAERKAWQVFFVACTTVCTLGATLTGGYAAEEKSPTTATATAPAPPSADSISAAKRDFETVKSARNPALQPKGELPRMRVPEMNTGNPVPGPWPNPKTATPEKKSDTWLIDALEKQKSRREDGDRRKGERDRTDPLGKATDRDETERDERREHARESQRELTASEIEERKRAIAANPLTRYLGEWMTPQDYALLKPSWDQSVLTTGGPNGASGRLAPAVGLPSGNDSAAGAALADLRGTISNSNTPRENPYLNIVNAPPLGTIAPVAPPPPPTAAPSAQSSALAPPPALPPAKAKIPDFAKPAQDEKYFKQLKRF